VSQVMGYRWHLRLKMAEQGMFATTELRPLLAERGVALSREQVYRLVTGVPERLSLRTLAALCDILDCTPSDLVEPVAGASRPSRRAAGPGGAAAGPKELRPVRARIISEPATGQ
jgi:DNA-binding Xre family transcriptional regulator